MLRPTSIKIYNQIKEEGLLSPKRLLIYGILVEQAPCTSSEAIAHLKKGSIFGIGSRFTELREMGAIKEIGTRKCKITGREVIVWDVTENLPKKLLKKPTKRQRLVNRLSAMAGFAEMGNPARTALTKLINDIKSNNY